MQDDENIVYEGSGMPQEINWTEVAQDIQNPAIIIAACRRSGKSFMTKEILYHIGLVQKFDLVILFSETANFNNDFDYVPKTFRYSGYKKEVLADIIKKQEQIYLKHQELKEKHKYYDKEPIKICIIFDDVAHDKSLFYSEEITKLFVLGRHVGLSIFFLTQHLSAISPKCKKILMLSSSFVIQTMIIESACRTNI